MTVPDPPADDVRERLDRLEEGVLYGERAAEELSESIADLSRRVDSILQRLARLEGRLGKVESLQEQGPDKDDVAGQDDPGL